MLALFVKVPTV